MYFYDIEVFKHDWIIVFKQAAKYTVFHNDNEAVRLFMKEKPFLAGFNNKWYDNHILKAILQDADNETIKDLSDYIFVGGKAWEHDWLSRQGFLWIESFDLKDDLYQGLSLKAIEAHLGLPIIESSVPFDIDRPLTKEELEETIEYCKNDTDMVAKLYELRQDYINSKKMLASMKNIPEHEAIGLTNAKLTARFLEAEPRERTDERKYVFPDNLPLEHIPEEVIKFFERIHDESIPDKELFSSFTIIKLGECKTKFAFGGVHGSLAGYYEKSTQKREIVNRDVASMYPSLIINYDYLSRSVVNSKEYEEIYHKRLLAKKNKDKEVDGSLKLVLNTTFGASGNKNNALYDPLPFRSICITGQLFISALAVELIKECKTFKLLNLNTDSIMYSIDVTEKDKAEQICKAWETNSKLVLEKEYIDRVWIKDVNALLYIDIAGKVKKIGGYLNHGISIKGAWNINNNFPIVKEAVLNYFINKVPVTKTIGDCDDPLKFQIIARGSSKFPEVFHTVAGERIKVNRCNRVYATKNKKYGTLVKVHHETGRDYKIPSLPDNCIIDNENKINITAIDKVWYNRLARKYIRDFKSEEEPELDGQIKMDIQKKEGGRKKMATEKNIYQRLLEARQQFQKKGVNKSGINTHAEFTYFELEDIVPVATEIFAKLDCMFLVNFDDGVAEGTLVAVEKPDESIKVSFPMRSISEPAKFRMNEIQGLGAEITYMRRYLYMMILDIVEADKVDSVEHTAESKKPKRPATAEKRQEIKQTLTATEDNATELQIKALKAVLKELKEKIPSQEEFIQTIAIKTEGFKKITKKQAEELILQVKGVLEGVK